MSLSHKDDYFETPGWLMDDIKSETGLYFHLDFCASKKNSKCACHIDEDTDALNHDFKNHAQKNAIFCNPPRSKNGKFVDKLYNEWKQHKLDIVILLCWNDLGNKYGGKILTDILKGNIEVHNLGKVKFYKDGKESEYPSRLTYFWAWLRAENNPQ